MASSPQMTVGDSLFHFVFDATFQFIGLLEPDGTLIEANQAALAFGGLTRADVVGKPFWACHWWTISPEVQTQLKEAVARAAQGQFVRYEVEVRGEGESTAILDFSLKPVLDQWGRVVKIIPEGRDITQMRKAEQAQADLHSMLYAVFDHSSDLILILDTQYHVLAFNARFRQAFSHAYQQEIQVGAHFLDLLSGHPYALIEASSHWQRALAGEEFTIERDFVGPDDAVTYYEVSFRKVVDAQGRQIGAVQSAHDVTERVMNQEALQQLNLELETRVVQRTAALMFTNSQLRAELEDRHRIEEALSQSEGQLKQLNETLEAQIDERVRQVQSLSKALTLAEQRERRRVSEVLHEDLQQLLFALDIKAHLLERLKDDPQLFYNSVQEVRAMIKNSIQATRTLAVELNPPVLRGDGLSASLGWLSRHFEEKYGLHVELQIEKNIQVYGEDMRMLLVQIIRELLFNVVKHAGVQHARVKVTQEQDHLEVSIEDDGKGFDPAQYHFDSTNHNELRSDQDTFGLFSVAERLKLFGGQLYIDSAPNLGTRIKVIVAFDGPVTSSEA